MSFATTEEIEQYARMTLKQHGFSDHSCVIYDDPKIKAWGLADPWDKRVMLSVKALRSFKLFRYVLLHEISHLIQHKRQGNSYYINGKKAWHNKVFRQVCKELGIPTSAKIPAHLLR
jgi:hypothetical protein